MTTRHELKTWPEYFAAVRLGQKTFEMRFDDREWSVGDVLVLKEFDPVAGVGGKYTGQVEEREILYLLRDEKFGVQPGFVAIGMAPIKKDFDALVMTLTPADLLAWHRDLAQRARLKTSTYTDAAERALKGGAGHATMAHRNTGMARFAAEEYAFHRQAVAVLVAPIPMVLHCPACGLQHVDAQEVIQAEGLEPHVTWENPSHRSHLCHGCGHIWRPADVATEGVAAIATKGQADSPPVEGWKRMPFEPTRLMWAAAGDAIVKLQAANVGNHDKIAEAVWTAMRDAAPKS